MVTITRRNLSRSLRGFIRACTLMVLVPLWTASAQPSIHAARVVLNHPTVELRWYSECAGVAVPVTKEQLRIVDVGEDSTEITSFDFTYPEAGKREPVTAVLVLDHSGSMTGSGIDGLKAAAHAFVDRLDPATDLCGIVWFSDWPRIGQRLTSDKAILHAGIEDVPRMGMTACWDGTCVGLAEVAQADPERPRTVIVIADGGDGSSSNTPAEIIRMANRERIRVCTIGLGSGIDAVQLERIALQTGGSYTQTPNAGQLASIALDLFDRATRMFDECSVTYTMPTDSVGGQLRTVRLMLRDVCGDTISTSLSYQVAGRTERPVHLALSDAVMGPDRIARMALRTSSPFPLDSLPRFAARVSKSAVEKHLRFIGIDTTSKATLRPGPGISVDAIRGSIQIQSDRVLIPVSDTVVVLLCEVFDPEVNGRYDLIADYAGFDNSSLRGISSGGSVICDAELRPAILTDDTLRFHTDAGVPQIQELTVRNTGGTSMWIHGMTFSGMPDGMLEVVDAAAVTIPPRGIARLPIKLSGAMTGSWQGRIHLATNLLPPGDVHHIVAAVTVLPAGARRLPQVPYGIDFRHIAVGSISDTVIRIVNPDAAPVRILHAEIRGRDAGAFELLRVPTEIPAFGSDSILVRCRSLIAWPIAARVRIIHDADDGAPVHTLLHALVGWPAYGKAEPKYNTFDFGGVPVGQSDTLRGVLRNAGGMPMQVRSWRLEPGSPSVFAIDSLPASLAPGEEVPFSVRFAPKDIGMHEARLYIGTSDPEFPEIHHFVKGHGSYPTESESVPQTAAALRIHGVHPAPARDHVTLQVELPQAAAVRVTIHDMRGREIHRHVFGEYGPGIHSLSLELSALRAGFYLIDIEAGGQRAGTRFLLR